MNTQKPPSTIGGFVIFIAKKIIAIPLGGIDFAVHNTPRLLAIARIHPSLEGNIK